MTTVTAHSHTAQREGPDITRPAGTLFAELFDVYLSSPKAIKEVIESMTKVVNDPDAEAEERAAALDTLVEVLFPPRQGSKVGVDLEEPEKDEPKSSQKARAAMARQEAAFSANLRQLMKERGLSQKTLAGMIGVGQPAISMMLSRECRPQRATVDKLAQALGVSARDLWPAP
jgi:predicted XRE-type DNA-binding protein